MKFSRLSLVFLVGLIFQLVGCAKVSTPEVVTVVVPATAVPINNSKTFTGVYETPVLRSTLVSPGSALSPECTIKQNINFRSGPGKAFDPPMDTLIAGTVVLPQSYQAIGFPSGAWVKVVNPGDHETGWVSAASDYLTCSVDLASLPSASIPSTPTPAAPRITNSQPQGDFQGFVGQMHLSNDNLVSLDVYEQGGQKNGDSIQQVTFIVNDKHNIVWLNKEDRPPYCIFGGTPNCAFWPKKDGQLAWSPNGPFIKNGEQYAVEIDVIAQDGKIADWEFDFTANLP